MINLKKILMLIYHMRIMELLVMMMVKTVMCKKKVGRVKLHMIVVLMVFQDHNLPKKKLMTTPET